jgi:epoxyqueuosine reductase
MTQPARWRVEGAAREVLRARLRAIGFDEVRFAAVAGGTGDGLRDWLAAGHHADMAWMERTADKRSDAGLVLPGACTVILLGVNYWPGALAAAPAGRPRWARYALHEDYHDTIKPGLVAAGRVLEEMGGLAPADYRYYVDTGPVLERGWAARSGLGFRGKNAMLISRRFGNWLFLASILVRADIAPDEPLRKKPVPAGSGEPAGLLCGKCTRCLDACPTGAFPAPGVVDARRCVSYQTIENRGIIPVELRAGIGDRVYGCDVCLEVCPWNRFAQAGRQLLLVARHELAALTLLELLELTPERFAGVFRRTAVKRLKLTGLLRNACVVAGNRGDASLLPRLVRLASHESPVVRAHAVWAVRRLAGGAAEELLAGARAAEQEAAVLAEYAAATS